MILSFPTGSPIWIDSADPDQDEVWLGFMLFVIPLH